MTHGNLHIAWCELLFESLVAAIYLDGGLEALADPGLFSLEDARVQRDQVVRRLDRHDAPLHVEQAVERLGIVVGVVERAETPLGFWLRDTLDFARNPWDRVGHLMQGFVPAILARELLRRNRLSPSRIVSAVFTAGSSETASNSFAPASSFARSATPPTAKPVSPAPVQRAPKVVVSPRPSASAISIPSARSSSSPGRASCRPTTRS